MELEIKAASKRKEEHKLNIEKSRRSRSRSSSSSIYSSSSEDFVEKSYGKSSHKKSKRNKGIQCAFCAEYHDENDCENRKNTGRYQQYENVRQKLAANNYSNR